MEAKPIAEMTKRTSLIPIDNLSNIGIHADTSTCWCNQVKFGNEEEEIEVVTMGVFAAQQKWEFLVIPCTRGTPLVVRGRLRGSKSQGVRDMKKHKGMTCKMHLVSLERLRICI